MPRLKFVGQVRNGPHGADGTAQDSGDAFRADLDVHLICDNYGTHKTPATKAWPARHPRFHTRFTPTGSSWINQVERWSGFLTGQMIRRGAHKGGQALEAGIRT